MSPRSGADSGARRPVAATATVSLTKNTFDLLCRAISGLELGTNQNATIVFPLLMDLLRPFLGNGAGPAPRRSGTGAAGRPLGRWPGRPDR